jgi:hypothetical protein
MTRIRTFAFRAALWLLDAFDRRDLTMLAGLLLLGSGLAASPWPWLGQVGPAIVLILAALGLSLARRTVP